MTAYCDGAAGAPPIANPDFLQEWLHRLFAAQEFLNRIADIPRIAHGVNFVAQSNSGLLIKVPIRRTFKNGSHVCGDGIGPGVPVIASIEAVEMTEVGNEGSAWINRQENFFQNWIGDGDAIIRRVLCVRSMQREV